MKTGLIYLATCVATRRSYVGQTSQSLRLRRQQHEYEALTRKSDGCKKFYRALRKYGADAFQWRVLAAEVPVADLDATEARLIAEMGSVDGGYNICREGVTTRGLKLSDETRRRMSMAVRPSKSAINRARLGAARRGMKFSAEWCKKIGDSKRGIKWSAEIVEKRVAKQRGRKRTPEQIARVVAGRKAAAERRLYQIGAP